VNWVTGIAVYVCIWWVVIFAVLPWGVRTPAEDGRQGFDPGAPERPLLLRKALVTTAIAAVLWAILYLVVHADLITFRET
jgi:predicted secreted protein